MSATEFEKEILRLLRKTPFIPFIIEFDDGEQFVVSEPKWLWYHSGESALFLRQDGSMDFVNAEAVRRLVELVPVAH